MNFCPDCGQRLGPGQKFCGTCGLDLMGRERLEAAALSGQDQELPIGASYWSAYYLGESGILGRRILSTPLFLLVVGGTLPIAVVLWLYLGHAPSTGALAAWLLVLLPILDELRFQGFRKLEGSPPDQFAKLRGGSVIGWTAISKVVLAPNYLAVFSGKRTHRVGVRLSNSGPITIRQVLSSRLGSRFTESPGRKHASFLGRLSVVVLLLFVVSEAILIAASVAPFFPGEQQAYTGQLGPIQQQISQATLLQQFWDIFSNNLIVALGVLFPGLGLFTLSGAAYNTGRIIEVIAIQSNVPPALIDFSLFTFPHTWIEELSYPLACALGLYYAGIWGGASLQELANRWKRRSTRLLIGFAGVVVMLAIAGAFEVIEPLFGLFSLALWIPVIAAGLYLLRRRRNQSSSIRTTGVDLNTQPRGHERAT
jgi:uncharacterized membrane protein SpoIIM required for sporulation